MTAALAAIPMSEEQLKAFLEKVKVDASLQEKLKAANDDDAFLDIAKEAGFSISTDDLQNEQSEISEEELEGVAGGEGSAGCLECCSAGSTMLIFEQLKH